MDPSNLNNAESPAGAGGDGPQQEQAQSPATGPAAELVPLSWFLQKKFPTETRRIVGPYSVKLFKKDEFLHLQALEFQDVPPERNPHRLAFCAGRTGEARFRTGQKYPWPQDAAAVAKDFTEAYQRLTGVAWGPGNVEPDGTTGLGYKIGAPEPPRVSTLRSDKFADKSDSYGFPTALSMFQDSPGGMPDGELSWVLPYSTGNNNLTPRNTVDKALASLAGAIREKNEWRRKVFDETIIAKWKAEVVAQSNDNESNNEHLFDAAKAFDLALAECRWAAASPVEDRFADEAGVDGVFRKPLPPTLVDGLLLLTRTLREAPAIGKTTPGPDYHPGSNDVVVDLVHPSMYCYERGETPVVKGKGADSFGEGDSGRKQSSWVEALLCADVKVEEKTPALQRTQQTQDPEDKSLASPTGLQWLPSEVEVGADGRCRLTSYVNGLHPKDHAGGYLLVEEALTLALPALERALAKIGPGPGSCPRDPAPARCGDATIDELIIDCNHPDRADYDIGTDDSDVYEDETMNPPALPDAFKPPLPLYPLGDVALTNRKLQVIVKLATYELTPKTSKFEGGTWHVEGARDERIVATACCVLEETNVTETSLQFRVAIQEPMYPQNDRKGVKRAYGLENNMTLAEDRGACRTAAGNVLAWPNVFQHRLAPFQVVDETKPGARTILVFFLVDPTLRVRSTATVPPQQRVWRDRALSTLLPATVADTNEVKTKILEYLGTGLDFATAAARRDRLMDERKAIFSGEYGQFQRDETMYNREFSLCEH